MRLHYLLFLLCSSFLTLSGQQDSLQAIAYVCPPCNSQCDELTFSAIGSCSHCGMDLIDARTANTRPNQPTTVAFYLQQGVEVLDFAGPLEVLSYAGFKVFTVSRTKAPITSQGVLNVVPDYSIEDAPEADILAFFGGNGYNTSQDTAVIAWINKQTDIKLHFSVCTGALILAEAGILNGKSATTFHNAIDLLENNYPEVTVLRETRFVDNGTVISTAGISAGIDGALHLVAKLKGFNTARATAYNMEYDNWQPGDGLLLCQDNPYAAIPAANVLKSYSGNYVHWELPEINIRYNVRDRGLEVYARQQRFPLYYLAEDTFTDVGGATVQFIRNTSGEITGYSHSSQPGRVYSRQAKH